MSGSYRLSPLNEGDETLNLAGLLSRLTPCGRPTTPEQWALCWNSVHILREVNKLGDFFQTLCVTPSTLAFELDGGQLRLLDLYIDPDVQYVPPEYETQGNTDQSHLYSLGKTLQSVKSHRPRRTSDPYTTLLTSLTARDPSDRPTLERVEQICVEALEGNDPRVVCQGLFLRALDSESLQQQQQYSGADHSDHSSVELSKVDVSRPTTGGTAGAGGVSGNQSKHSKEIEQQEYHHHHHLTYTHHHHHHEEESSSNRITNSCRNDDRPLVGNTSAKEPLSIEPELTFMKTAQPIGEKQTSSCDTVKGSIGVGSYKSETSGSLSLGEGEKLKVNGVGGGEDLKGGEVLLECSSMEQQNGKPGCRDPGVKNCEETLRKTIERIRSRSRHYRINNIDTFGRSISGRSCDSNNDHDDDDNNNSGGDGYNINNDSDNLSSCDDNDDDDVHDGRVSSQRDKDESVHVRSHGNIINPPKPFLRNFFGEILGNKSSAKHGENFSLGKWMSMKDDNDDDDGNADDDDDNAAADDDDDVHIDKGSAVELVRFGNPDRSALWNFEEGNRNLVDLMLGDDVGAKSTENGKPETSSSSSSSDMTADKDPDVSGSPSKAESGEPKALKVPPIIRVIPEVPMVPVTNISPQSSVIVPASTLTGPKCSDITSKVTKNPQQPTGSTLTKVSPDTLMVNTSSSSSNNNSSRQCSRKSCSRTDGNHGNPRQDGDEDDDDDGSLLEEMMYSVQLPPQHAQTKVITLQDIINTTDLYFDEVEVWALCREAVLHVRTCPDTELFPSLDSVGLQPDGHMEVIDLKRTTQTVKDLSADEKATVQCIGVILCRASGQLQSTSIEELNMSEDLTDLIGSMTCPQPENRASLEAVWQRCEHHERTAAYTSENICQSLYEECWHKMVVAAEKTEDFAGSDEDLAIDREEIRNLQDVNLGKQVSNPSSGNSSSSNASGAIVIVGDGNGGGGSGDCSSGGLQGSAFSSVSRKPDKPGALTHNIPQAFRSGATHFKPIVVNSETFLTTGVKFPELSENGEGMKATTSQDVCQSKTIGNGKMVIKSAMLQDVCGTKDQPSGPVMTTGQRVVEKLKKLEQIYTKRYPRAASRGARLTPKLEPEVSTPKNIPANNPQSGDTVLSQKIDMEQLTEMVLNKLQDHKSLKCPPVLSPVMSEYSSQHSDNPQLPVVMVPAQNLTMALGLPFFHHSSSPTTPGATAGPSFVKMRPPIPSTCHQCRTHSMASLSVSSSSLSSTSASVLSSNLPNSSETPVSNQSRYSCSDCDGKETAATTTMHSCNYARLCESLKLQGCTCNAQCECCSCCQLHHDRSLSLVSQTSPHEELSEDSSKLICQSLQPEVASLDGDNGDGLSVSWQQEETLHQLQQQQQQHNNHPHHHHCRHDSHHHHHHHHHLPNEFSAQKQQQQQQPQQPCVPSSPSPPPLPSMPPPPPPHPFNNPNYHHHHHHHQPNQEQQQQHYYPKCNHNYPNHHHHHCSQQHQYLFHHRQDNVMLQQQQQQQQHVETKHLSLSNIDTTTENNNNNNSNGCYDTSLINNNDNSNSNNTSNTNTNTSCNSYNSFKSNNSNNYSSNSNNSNNNICNNNNISNNSSNSNNSNNSNNHCNSNCNSSNSSSNNHSNSNNSCNSSNSNNSNSNNTSNNSCNRAPNGAVAETPKCDNVQTCHKECDCSARAGIDAKCQSSKQESSRCEGLLASVTDYGAEASLHHTTQQTCWHCKTEHNHNKYTTRQQQSLRKENSGNTHVSRDGQFLNGENKCHRYIPGDQKSSSQLPWDRTKGKNLFTNKENQPETLKESKAFYRSDKMVAKQLGLIYRIMDLLQPKSASAATVNEESDYFLIGAGIGSLKGLPKDKFQLSVATMYPNQKWEESCLEAVFHLINQDSSPGQRSMWEDLPLEEVSGERCQHQHDNPSLEYLIQPLPFNPETIQNHQKAGNSLQTFTLPELSGTFHDREEDDCEHFTDLSVVKGSPGDDEEEVFCDQGEVMYFRSGVEDDKAFQTHNLLGNSDKILKYGLKDKGLSESYGYNNDDNDDDDVMNNEDDGGKGRDVDRLRGLGRGEENLKENFLPGPTVTCKTHQFDSPVGINNVPPVPGKYLDQGMDPDSESLRIHGEDEEDLSYRLYVRENFHGTSQPCDSSSEKYGFQEIQLSDRSQGGNKDRETTTTTLTSSEITQTMEGQTEGVDIQKFMLPDVPKTKLCSADTKESKTSQTAAGIPIPSTGSQSNQGRNRLNQCRSDENVNSKESDGHIVQEDGSLDFSAVNVFQEATITRKPSLDSQEFYQTIAGHSWSKLKDYSEGNSRIIYHPADLAYFSHNMEVEQFLNDIDQSDEKCWRSKLSIVQQQVMLKSKEWIKMERFYLRMKNKHSATKNERQQMLRLSNDLRESGHTLSCYKVCRNHLEMLLCGECSLSQELVHSLATCEARNNPHSDSMVWLTPCDNSPLLHYHSTGATTGLSVGEGSLLYAGTPQGLFANLYTRTALTSGYIHQFLYCYRYFTSPLHLLVFLTSTYTLSHRVQPPELCVILSKRSLLLLSWWLKDYYTVDFTGRDSLKHLLEEFIVQLPEDDASAEMVRNTHSLVTTGQSQDRKVFSPEDRLSSTVSSVGNMVHCVSSSKCDVYYFDPSLDTSGKPEGVEACRLGGGDGEILPEDSGMFCLTDYTGEQLAEQLTLMEQELFQDIHPVHLLNSKYNGFNPSLVIPGWSSTRSIRMKRDSATSLFVEDSNPSCSAIELQVKHDHQISHWVGAELILAPSTKVQVTILEKFLTIARICFDVQNFATSIAILDGLENALIRQLPVWKELSSKTLANFTSLLMSKTSGPCCVAPPSDKSVPEGLCQPQIPSILPLLLNVQQCEIGSFSLTNGMYKWAKMRHITKAIDSLRQYHQHRYHFRPAPLLQLALHHRIDSFREMELNVLAQEHGCLMDRGSNLGAGSGSNPLNRVMRRVKSSSHRHHRNSNALQKVMRRVKERLNK